jgi:3-(3-hydroxy-phenyl)propionate hydroxylase
LGDGFLLGQLGGAFLILTIDADAPDQIDEGGIVANRVALSTGDDSTGALAARYLGEAKGAVYLIRPDQHVVARWDSADEATLRAALRKACGKE